MKLYVGNLAEKVNESDIENFFSAVEQPDSINLIKDRYTGESRGFAFVEYRNSNLGNEAIDKFNGQELCGKAVTVNQARERKENNFGGRRW